MTARPPGDEERGLLIGDAAGLLGITPKAVRLYHRKGLLPEPERDESDYRRYRSTDLAALARIVRLRDIGLSLREITPLVQAHDGGTALRRALQDLDEQLAIEIAERRRRRRLLAELREEHIGDAVEAAAASVAEERLIVRLREVMPDMTADEEAFHRRLQRALDAFQLPGSDPEALERREALADELLEVTGGRKGLVDRQRRLYALVDAEVDDPRVGALAEDMRAIMRQATAAVMKSADAEAPELNETERERWYAAISAALSTLPPAVRRVWEQVYKELLDGLGPASDNGDDRKRQ